LLERGRWRAVEWIKEERGKRKGKRKREKKKKGKKN
jgi:hypothetical protein